MLGWAKPAEELTELQRAALLTTPVLSLGAWELGPLREDVCQGLQVWEVIQVRPTPGQIPAKQGALLRFTPSELWPE